MQPRALIVLVMMVAATLAIAVMLFLSIANKASAQVAICIPAFSEEAWTKGSGEVIHIRAVLDDGALIRVMVHPKTGKFTILVTGRSTCVIGRGSDWDDSVIAILGPEL